MFQSGNQDIIDALLDFSDDGVTPRLSPQSNRSLEAGSEADEGEEVDVGDELEGVVEAAEVEGADPLHEELERKLILAV